MDQPADTAAFRATLRRAKIAARQAMPEEVHRQASALTLDHLSTLLADRPVGCIGFCWPIRAEVDCRPVVLRLIEAGWSAAMPVVVALTEPMEFRGWSATAPMVQDPHGIPVPDNPACPPPDVLLLPLVAWDADNFRLGYGGGYFDRTLASCNPHPVTIGVGFALGEVATIRPEPHDIPLDWIVTENGPRHSKIWPNT